jgi:predicted metal-dependent phosphoesterase TrpH
MDYLTGWRFPSACRHTVHIVGLGFDAQMGHCSKVCTPCATAAAHAPGNGHQLALAGIPGAYEGALRYVGNPS